MIFIRNIFLINLSDTHVWYNEIKIWLELKRNSLEKHWFFVKNLWTWAEQFIGLGFQNKVQMHGIKIGI